MVSQDIGYSSTDRLEEILYDHWRMVRLGILVHGVPVTVLRSRLALPCARGSPLLADRAQTVQVAPLCACMHACMHCLSISRR